MRQYILLVVLILAILMLYSFFPKLEQPLTEDQAREFVVKDLASVDADSRILHSTKLEGGAWAFEVLVTTNAHTPCPTVEKRFYKLPPVSFRPEPFISGCYERNSLLFREEALINSAKKLHINDGYGCAFKAKADWASEKSYCPKGDFDAIASFSQDVPPESWVAYWQTESGIQMISLDENGNVLKIA